MSKTKTWENLTLEDILRVDYFDQQIYIHDPVSRTNAPLVRDNREFYTEIYAPVSCKTLEIIDGGQHEKRTIDIELWRNRELANTENSLVVFIEGYAGCGKSTFVQDLLSKQLNTYNYDYSYYNYDIGAYYDNKKAHRIVAAIRECFIQQLIKCINKNKERILEKFKALISQYEIRYLDTEMKLFNDFVNKRTFKDAVIYLKNSKNENNFRSVMHELMKDFSCEQMLSLDYIFRIAEYIVREDHTISTIYVCYDNMDSIENFDELAIFDNTLVSLRKNIDDYINETSKNFEGIPVPRFVIIATYRKITAGKVNLFMHSERMDDFSEYNQYIQNIDASHFYSYHEIIESRRKYFLDYTRRRKLDATDILSKLKTANILTETEFVHNKYAGLWNNNYRTCSSILHRIFKSYYDESVKCGAFIDKKIDGYDIENSAYYGASAIFLSLVCKVFNSGGLWGNEHMSLITLNVKNDEKPACELTSLSRLILMYIANKTDHTGKNQPVSTLELFKEFGDLFSADIICRTLSNMLARDKTDTWRRPIYYHRNAINDNENIEVALRNQWDASRMINKQATYPYTELLLCECGSAYIERLMSEFEFFANRLSNKNCSIYLLSNVSDISRTIEDVYNAVENCCKDMVKFCEIYMEKKGISNFADYVRLPIHPRTNNGNPQLHTERIIFSHISYINNCRMYHLDQVHSMNEKKALNNMFVEYIQKYLGLYQKYIAPICQDREKLATELSRIVDEISSSSSPSTMFQPVSRGLVGAAR